jgi:uroporphyrinogen-III synthase
MNPPRKKSPQGLPLAGIRILVGRARHQASALSAGVKKLGAEVIEIPFIEIRKPRSYEPLDVALKAIADYDWLILTSVNGVEALSKRMRHLRVSPKTFKQLKIAAIGPATREEIETLGLKVNVVPERYIAESVVECLRGKVEGKRVLLARAKVARDVIPRELRKMGAHVDVVEAYKTVVPASSRARLRFIMKDPKRRPNVVTFTSSSTVINFANLMGMSVDPSGFRVRPHVRRQIRSRIRSGGTSANSPALQRREDDPFLLRPVGTAAISPSLADLQFASIGPITSATLRDLGLPVHIEATKYTIPGLIHAIARYNRRS